MISPRSPKNHPLHLLLRCSNTLVREASRLLAPLGITPAQFNALNLLHHSPDGARPSSLAQDLVVDPSSATYLIGQLIKAGWIKKHPDPIDGRAYRLQLTAAGRKIHTEAGAVYFPTRDALSELATTRELTLLEDLLGRFTTAAPTFVTDQLNPPEK